MYTLKYTEINETTIFEDHSFPEQLQLSSLFFNVHGLLEFILSNPIKLDVPNRNLITDIVVYIEERPQATIVSLCLCVGISSLSTLTCAHAGLGSAHLGLKQWKMYTTLLMHSHYKYAIAHVA